MKQDIAECESIDELTAATNKCTEVEPATVDSHIEPCVEEIEVLTPVLHDMLVGVRICNIACIWLILVLC